MCGGGGGGTFSVSLLHEFPSLSNLSITANAYAE